MKKNYFFLVSATILSLICLGQNVGIGIPTPAAPLHIKSSSTSTFGVEILRVEARNPFIGFYDNSKGYIGYLWYNTDKLELGTPAGSTEPVVIAPARNFLAFFTTNGRVGIGISNPTEKLDVNGNINLNGLIKVNGSPGSSGQVLTSNGTGDPQWKNAAYGNNTRFSVSLTSSTGVATGTALITTRYNLNAADIVIGASSITINHAGLYHFDFSLNAFMNFTDAPIYNPRFDWTLHLGSDQYDLIFEKQLETSSDFRFNWYGFGRGSLDVYVPAAIVLTMRYSQYNPGSIYSTSGYLTGHLISD